MPELVNLRTRFTKTHDNGDGTKTLEAFPQPIHYDDGQGGMGEITRGFVPSDRPGYDWMSGDNEFRMHFKENLNQADSMLFIRNGIEVASRPKGVVLHRNDTGAHIVLGTPSDTTCVVDGPNITFSGLYPHCKVRYQNRGDSVKEFIRMTSFAGIPDPTDYGINPDVVRVGFVTELNPSGHDSFDDGTGNAVQENVDLPSLAFSKAGVRQVFIPSDLEAWSEGWDKPRPRPVIKRFKMIGGKPHMIHGLKYVDLVARSLPYIIDATWGTGYTSGTNDGSWESNGLTGFYNTATQGYIGHAVPKGASYDEECFFRFTNVTIPNGSTINTASFTYYKNGGTGTGLACAMGCVDADNAAAPTTQAQAEALVLTTNYQSFTVGTGVGTRTFNAAGFVAAVQEVIDRVGWSSGNALTVLAKVAGSVGINIYDIVVMSEHATLAPPSLTITYTPPSTNLSVNDVSLDIDVTSAAIYGPLVANNVTVGTTVTSATLAEAGGDLVANDVTLATTVTSVDLALIAGNLVANDVTVDTTVTAADLTLTAGNLTANDVTVDTTVTSADLALTAGNLVANDVTVDTTVTAADLTLTAGNLTANDVTVGTAVTSADLTLTAGNLDVNDILLAPDITSATITSTGWTGTISGEVDPAAVDGVSVANIVSISGV